VAEPLVEVEDATVLEQKVIEALFTVARRDWDVLPLGEVCERGGGNVQTGPFGSQLHKSDYVTVGIPSIMPVNIGDNRVISDGIARITPEDAERLSRYRVRAGDIVCSRRGDVERRALIRQAEDGWLCGTGSLRVRVGEGVANPIYASYYLGHPAVRGWIVRHAIGATMPNLNTSILSALPFVLPPLPEQEAIARILGALDDKIELNRRMNETLEATARAIFKSWFVDFDPVPAKAEGRAPPGLDPATAALFPDRLVDSEIGEIPQGWSVGTLADVASLNPESWSKDTRPDIINYIDLSNTKWGRIETVTVYAQQDAPSRAQRVLRSGDSIVGTVRPGNGSYAFIAEGDLTGSTGFAVLRPHKIEYAGFVYLGATDSENIEALAHLADGAAYPAVRPEVVAATPVVLPCGSIVGGFAKGVAPLLARTAANERESRTLAAIRDALLPKLLSGELRVRDTEKLVEANWR